MHDLFRREENEKRKEERDHDIAVGCSFSDAFC